MKWQGWLLFVLTFLIGFAYWEWQGIKKHGTRGTLSNLIWMALFSDWDKDRDDPRWVVWLPLLGLWIWLSVHFFAGGRWIGG